MLSRVAESLYWTARYIERAEDTSRLLHVHFHGMLDADLPGVHLERRGQAWRELVLQIGRDDLFLEHFDEYTARTVSEFLLLHPSNPDAVTACIARARENARGVREQISSEMWEHLNRLHLLVSRSRAATVLAHPHDFFVRIRDGSHAFAGVTKATLSRGEAYEFLELGAHLERADFTTRFLSLQAPELPGASESALTQLLKSCGSWEAFHSRSGRSSSRSGCSPSSCSRGAIRGRSRSASSSRLPRSGRSQGPPRSPSGRSGGSSPRSRSPICRRSTASRPRCSGACAKGSTMPPPRSPRRTSRRA